MPIHNQFPRDLFFDQKGLAKIQSLVVTRYSNPNKFDPVFFRLEDQDYKYQVKFNPASTTYVFTCEAKSGQYWTAEVKSTPRDRISLTEATSHFLQTQSAFAFQNFVENLEGVWVAPYPSVDLKVVESDVKTGAVKLLLDGKHKAVARFSLTESTPYLLVMPDFHQGRRVVSARSFNDLARDMRRLYAAYTKTLERAQKMTS